MAERRRARKGRPRRASDHPATTPEAREQELIALAMDLAEEQLRNGTASPSVMAHFLKMGSTREEKEQDLLVARTSNLAAKTEAIYSSQQVEELYREAIDAMKVYNGSVDYDEEL